jgi:hypothetical protein
MSKNLADDIQRLSEMEAGRMVERPVEGQTDLERQLFYKASWFRNHVRPITDPVSRDRYEHAAQICEDAARALAAARQEMERVHWLNEALRQEVERKNKYLREILRYHPADDEQSVGVHMARQMHHLATRALAPPEPESNR